jgi:hypothetical protein
MNRVPHTLSEQFHLEDVRGSNKDEASPLIPEPHVLLKAVQSQHADYFKEMADLHARSREHTQAWCYAAFEESAACFARFQAKRTGLGAVHPSRLPEVYHQLNCEFEHSVAHVLSAWRATKGIFRFDDALFSALMRTREMRALPNTTMLMLPHWCVYVEAAGKVAWEGQRVRGFFAMLHCEAADRPNPILVLLLHSDKWQALFRVPLVGATLDEALVAAAEDHWRTTQTRLTAVEGCELRVFGDAHAEACDVQWEAVKRELPAILNLLLYLCAENADFGIRERPNRPTLKTTRKGRKLFPPQAPQEWEVGVRIGAELRRALDAAPSRCKIEGAIDDALAHIGARPRAHIRRAHWHHYWTGPRQVERPGTQGEVFEQRAACRTLVLRWVMPVLVNASSSDALPAVVRPLYGERPV